MGTLSRLLQLKISHHPCIPPTRKNSPNVDIFAYLKNLPQVLTPFFSIGDVCRTTQVLQKPTAAEVNGGSTTTRSPVLSVLLRDHFADALSEESCFFRQRQFSSRENDDTPPKTNMEPENGPLEKEIPIGNHHFQVPAVNFWGCI